MQIQLRQSTGEAVNSVFDARILPEDKWGPGYGKPYTLEDLDTIVRIVNAGRMGSGQSQRRLFGQVIESADGRLWLPEGHDAEDLIGKGSRAYPYDYNLATSSTPPYAQLPKKLQVAFSYRGWLLDQHGRPCHPHLDQLLDGSQIGLNTGLGNNPFYGEQVAVTAQVYSGNKILLNVSKKDRTKFYLPTGYSTAFDYGFSAASWYEGSRPVSSNGIFNTVMRIIDNNAGLRISQNAKPQIIDADRLPGADTTINSWRVTYNFCFRLPPEADQTLDSRCQSRWITIGDLEANSLPPSHWRVIQAMA